MPAKVRVCLYWFIAGTYGDDTFWDWVAAVECQRAAVGFLQYLGVHFFWGRAFLRDLRIKTKETGFLLNLQATTKDFPKKPGF
jgi:hypothetical protein